MELSQVAAQSQRQIQVQRMSQRQIQAMKILSLATSDVENEIYEFAEKNPALEVSERAGSRERTGASRPKADFDAIIDREADTRTSLFEHLSFQLNALPLSEPERELGAKLIGNLDGDGHHILSPYSFLGSAKNDIAVETLEKILSLIQTFDPVGTCVKNVEESLLVQAKNAPEPNNLALFILDGHFDFLDPPRADKVLKKLKAFSSEEKKLKSYGSDDSRTVFSKLNLEKITLSDVENAVRFIKTLDPKPARAFGSFSPNFVRVDAVVKNDGGNVSVSFPQSNLPDMRISADYEILCGKKAVSEQEKANVQFARQSIFEAQSFMEAVSYRKSSLQKAALEIASVQYDFFVKGPAFLKPFLQKDLAETLGVHETTVSRIANGKYLSCDFGVFPFGYFFTTQVGAGQKTAMDESSKMDGPAVTSPSSKEAVKFKISQILLSHKGDKKPPSDQKISDLLAQEGISVARRTVAKYRAELNVGSSYER